MATIVRSIGSQSWTVTGATNASPIVLTLSASHTFKVGQRVYCFGFTGNTAPNIGLGGVTGEWTVQAVSSTTVTLQGSTGNGTYTGGGTIARRFSNVAAWAAGTTALGGNIEVGELYDDADFTEVAGAAEISGASSSTTSYRILRAWSGGANGVARYDPAAQTGVRILKDVTPTYPYGIRVNESYVRLEGFLVEIFDGGSWSGSGTAKCIDVSSTAKAVRITDCVVRNTDLVIGSGPADAHGISHTAGTGVSGEQLRIINCIALGSGVVGTGLVTGIRCADTYDEIFNCGANRCTGSAGSGRGIRNDGSNSRIQNCWSIGSSFQDFLGFSGTFTNNCSSDTTAVGTNCFTMVQPSAMFVYEAFDDYRPTPSSVLVDNGINLSSFSTLDIILVTRTTPWEIGPYQGHYTVNTSAPTITYNTIGIAGRDYPSIFDWEAATRLNLVYRNEVYIGLLCDDADFNLGSVGIELGGALSDSRRYRQLSPNSTPDKYEPRGNTGVTFIGDATDLIRITEDFFRFSGAKISSQAVTGDSSCLKVTSQGCLVSQMVFEMTDGTSDNHRCYWDVGSENTVRNSIAIGNTASLGANFGFVLEGELGRCQNSASLRIRRGTAVMFTDGGVSGNLFENCLAGAGSGDIGFDVVDSTYLSHCGSSDTTADGPGCLDSLTYTDIWNDSGANDLRLKPTADVINAGTKLTYDFQDDFDGTIREGPWEMGPYADFIRPPDYAAQPSGQVFRQCRLFALERADGREFLLTDHNRALVFRGRTHVPSTSVSTSARRHESGGKESNFELRGAISSDDITYQDLLARRFDSATLYEWLADWRFPWAAPRLLRVYTIMSMDFDRGSWTAQLGGITSVLRRRIGNKFTKTCPKTLGSQGFGKCKVNLRAFTDYNRVVSSVIDSRRVFTVTSITPAFDSDDYFKYGTVVWRSGSNLDIPTNVIRYVASSNRVELMQRLPFDIEVGDIFDLQAGCDWLPDTCDTKFGNKHNFGGLEFTPGTKKAWQTPRR